MVRAINLPHDHKCSKRDVKKHMTPHFIRDRALIGCQDRYSGEGIFTLFNITWQCSKGILSAGTTVYLKQAHTLLITPNGYIMHAVTGRGVFYVRFLLPNITERISIKAPRTPGIAFMQKIFYQKQSTYLLFYYNKSKLMVTSMELNILCFQSSPWYGKHIYYELIKVTFTCPVQQRKQFFHQSPLIDNNGDFFSPIFIAKPVRKTKKKKTFRYFYVYKRVD
jgi:hypothetical protein